jgi:hypothetical protein
MRNRLFLGLLLPALLAAQAPDTPKPNAPPPAPEPPAPPKPFGTLRVHVSDSKGAPLAKALVSVPKLQRAHETGESGDVVLGWIPVGKVEVNVSRIGYKPVAASATITPDGIQVLSLHLEAETK